MLDIGESNLSIKTESETTYSTIKDEEFEITVKEEISDDVKEQNIEWEPDIKTTIDNKYEESEDRFLDIKKNKYILSEIKHKKSEQKCDECSDQCKTCVHTKSSIRKIFECEQCSFKTKSRESLKNHIIVKHKEDEEIEWFKCEHCSYKGKCRHHLTHHLNTKHTTDSETYNCDNCKYVTKSKRNLRNHVKMKHLISSQTIKWFDCEYCSFKTKRKYYLKLHMMSKHPRV